MKLYKLILGLVLFSSAHNQVFCNISNTHHSAQVKKEQSSFTLPAWDVKTIMTGITMGLLSGACWAEYVGIAPSTQHALCKILVEHPISQASGKVIDKDKQTAFSWAYFLASQAGYYLSQYVESTF